MFNQLLKEIVHKYHKPALFNKITSYKISYFVIIETSLSTGFHEAIGDAISLSISSPKHLQKLGLVHKSVDDTAHDINFLFALALDKVNLLSINYWLLIKD